MVFIYILINKNHPFLNHPRVELGVLVIELVRVAEDGRREAEDEAQQLTAALQNATARERATRDEFDSVVARVEGLNKVSTAFADGKRWLSH
jgi:hypothetical protein